MAKITKEERIKMLEVKLKNLKASTQKEERRIRTKKLIEIGAYVSSLADVNFIHDLIQNDKEGIFKRHLQRFPQLIDYQKTEKK